MPLQLSVRSLCAAVVASSTSALLVDSEIVRSALKSIESSVLNVAAMPSVPPSCASRDGDASSAAVWKSSSAAAT